MSARGVARIDLLGGFRFHGGGGSGARAPTARQQELLTYLILRGRAGPVPRQRVAGALWPESADGQALTNLRRELHHLREGWTDLDACIHAGTRTLAWVDEAARVDIVLFETAAVRGLAGDRTALQDAARIYRGDLLPDCIAEWIDEDRQRLRQRSRQVLVSLVDALERDQSFSEAIEHAQHLCRLDPLDERTWCALMRCHAHRGDRATALHLYQQCAALLKKELGIAPSAGTRKTYREILDLEEAAPAIITSPRATMYPLVGRRAEWHALLSAWQEANAGRSRLVLIRGEAGIGKSRLAEELADWCRLQHVKVVSSRCYPGEGRLAYAPIAAWLNAGMLQPALMKLDPSSATEVARLRPDVLTARPDVPAPQSHLESWQRLRFFEALAAAFRSASPLVLILDDVQWADAETLEWLEYFLRSASGSRCLVVATSRAEEEEDNRPLGRMLSHRDHDEGLSVIALGRLDQAATAELAGAVVEHPLDERTLARTFNETEGHPLFIVERGRMALAGGDGSSDARALPRVQAVVAARLALLSDDARAAAEVAAAVGRDFRFDILAAASDLDEDALIRALDELWRRHIVRAQADQRWDFSHDRIREVAYSGIGPARARLIHRRIAQGMELLFAENLDAASASIAMHLARSGQPGRAVPFLERAAAVAVRVSANEEAIRRLTDAISLLETLPAGRDRNARELALRSALSSALNPARGYGAVEVEQNLERVFSLHAQDSGEIPVRWLWAAFAQRFMRGDLKGTRQVSEEALSRSPGDASCRCEAHHAMAGTLSCVGELDASKIHFEAALAAYDERRPQRSALGSDLGVFAHAWYSHTLWLLGEDAAAASHADAAVALARRLDHVYSETLALAYGGLLHQMRGDIVRLIDCAEQVVALCAKFGFAYYGDWAQVLIGWTRSLERPREGIEIIEGALARLDAQRAQGRRPYYMSLLADAYQRADEGARSAAIVDAAIVLAVARGDAWWLPALYAQKSEREPEPDGERTRQMALDLARAQHSRALEQRILAARRTLSRTI